MRLSHEWQASTSQRRARQSGWRVFCSISSPRVRMCGVSPYSKTSSREWALSYALSRQMPWGCSAVGSGRSIGIESSVGFSSL